MNCYKCKIQWDYRHLQTILCSRCKDNSNFDEKELPQTLEEALRQFSFSFVESESIMPLRGYWNGAEVRKLL